MLQRTKQWVLNSLAILFFLVAFFVISANFVDPVPFRLFQYQVESVYMGWTLLTVSALLSLAVFFKMLAEISAIRHQALKTAREREKAEVGAESSASQVQALEAKIQTLETALDEALKRSDTSAS